MLAPPNSDFVWANVPIDPKVLLKEKRELEQAIQNKALKDKRIMMELHRVKEKIEMEMAKAKEEDDALERDIERVEALLEIAYRASPPRRSSSARRSEELKKLPRKHPSRKAHFTRKAISARRKEEERRRKWEGEFGSSREDWWKAAEELRKEGKVSQHP